MNEVEDEIVPEDDSEDASLVTPVELQVNWAIMGRG